MFALRWLISSTVRRATAARRHVAKLLAAQRDILSPAAVENVSAALAALKSALGQGANKETLSKLVNELEEAANKWLKPYPHPAWRENVEVLLVAIAVAMAIRTFFLQPFKIPTGSMQPTLFGITHTNLGDSGEPMPGFLTRLFDYWVNGVSYVRVVAKADGALGTYESKPHRVLLFNLSQTFQVGGQKYTVWFPPDDLLERAHLADRFGNTSKRVFKAGENIINLKVTAGDHLFVNRFTYNFRKPERGDIIVFSTSGIERLPQNQYYIKRLVALGGETVQIGNDRHLRINGRWLDASTPHFEFVYGFDPKAPIQDSHYVGHLNQTVAQSVRQLGQQELAPNFENEQMTQTVDKDSYMVMGDNTVNSYDSRGWGEFPAGNVIGKSSLVYWPISKRFGWGYR